VPSGTGLNYQWSQNSATITGATNNTLAVNASGNYSVSITGGANCITSSLTQSVTVNPSPTITVISSASLLCVGQNATITAGGATSYTWSTSSNSTAIVVSPSITTTYTVDGTGSNSCKGFATITQSVSACTEISELNSNNSLNVYPNPAHDQVIIELPNSTSGMTVKVVNVIGQSVIEDFTSSRQLKIVTTDLAKGMYYVIVESEKKITTTKLIIE
jgi:hypothetical protein